MNLALFLTILRILMVPVILWGIVKGYYALSCVLFALAGITDFLDGFVARNFNQETRLGSILDPLADKILGTSLFCLLGYYGQIPIWLVIMVFVRDIFILIGIGYIKLRKIPINYNPLRISKVNTFIQIVFLFMVLLGNIFSFIRVLIPPIIGVLCITTMFSFIGYIKLFWKTAR